MGLAGDKGFIKINFEVKIEIGIIEILDVPNFNKFWAFLIYTSLGWHKINISKKLFLTLYEQLI